MTLQVDMHKFIMSVKDLVNRAIDAAEEKAIDTHTPGIPSYKANMFARKICSNTFKDFSNDLKKEFPSESVQSLLNLTIGAKEMELTDRLVSVIAKIILTGEKPKCDQSTT